MIKENIKQLLRELPDGVHLVGAVKTRTGKEILEAIEAGLEIIGENYVQEAERTFEVIGSKVKWHMIGHLQSNKAKKAARIFDMIETVDSFKLAKTLDNACGNLGKNIPILIEINSGEEFQKSGVLPSEAIALVKHIAVLENIKIMGLMTMGPFSGNPEEARPYFIKTRMVFDDIKQKNLPNVEMKYLSMGMSNSYKVAIEEGANMVRIGTNIFGERHMR